MSHTYPDLWCRLENVPVGGPSRCPSTTLVMHVSCREIKIRQPVVKPERRCIPLIWQWFQGKGRGEGGPRLTRRGRSAASARAPQPPRRLRQARTAKRPAGSRRWNPGRKPLQMLGQTTGCGLPERNRPASPSRQKGRKSSAYPSQASGSKVPDRSRGPSQFIHRADRSHPKIPFSPG